jgi:hypothetical protein
VEFAQKNGKIYNNLFSPSYLLVAKVTFGELNPREEQRRANPETGLQGRFCTHTLKCFSFGLRSQLLPAHTTISPGKWSNAPLFLNVQNGATTARIPHS